MLKTFENFFSDMELCDDLRLFCDDLPAICDDLKPFCDDLRAVCDGLRSICDDLKLFIEYSVVKEPDFGFLPGQPCVNL